MSGVEFGLAIAGIPGVIDICCKYFRKFIETCEAISQADSRVRESTIRFRACWLRIETQLQVLQRLEPLLSDEHRQVQQEILEILQRKLHAAHSKLAGLTKTSVTPQLGAAGAAEHPLKAKKFKYGLLRQVREGLDDAFKDLESWQGIFDPSWLLLLRLANPEVDRQLESVDHKTNQSSVSGQNNPSASIIEARYFRRAIYPDEDTSRSVFLPADGLETESIRLVALSPVSTARRLGNGQLVLLDPVTGISAPGTQAALRDIRNFARRLRHADPRESGLLACKGVLRENTPATDPAALVTTGLTFVFTPPPGHDIVESLRSRLLQGPEQAPASLSDRFMLAQQLVKAASSVHQYGFVHKNIRPETVLLLSRDGGRLDGPRNLGGEESENTTAVLVGFDVLRDADGKTNRVGDDDWSKNLYRHPTRQGRVLQVDYDMRHDIYSVGVCLLELGLWESFVNYGSQDNSFVAYESAMDCDDGAGQPSALLPRLGHGMTILGSESGSDLLWHPEETKKWLLKLAAGPLKQKMGTRYSRVVQTCLTCLDPDNTDFGDAQEFQDIDGVAVGVRYIAKVVSQLGEIVV